MTETEVDDAACEDGIVGPQGMRHWHADAVCRAFDLLRVSGMRLLLTAGCGPQRATGLRNALTSWMA
ncbi:hypothetical protein GCM10009839_10240 [Catenulispora yoronensis]|uniref:Uncharacterized protein n=1 Tax=Catenulispora yoronensis TaxID=450799 RepID=A0ABP5F7M7_9ACTN